MCNYILSLKLGWFGRVKDRFKFLMGILFKVRLLIVSCLLFEV